MSFFGRARAGKACVDHQGKEWRSFAAMCRGWGRATSCVRSRLKAKPPMTLEEALTSPKAARAGIPVTMPDGKVFRSRRQAGIAFGVSNHAIESRIRDGMIDAEAVSRFVREKRRGPIVDHMGIQYPTVSAMCAAYGVSFQTFRYRREVAGYALSVALTASTRRAA